jgi:small subunit ribosomal protein S6
MQKNYELLYIVHPDLEGSTDKVTEKVTGFINRPGGKVTSQEDWGKRKLAYPISKNDFGVYVLVNFTIDSEKLSDVERDMRLSEEVLRSMIVVVPDLKEVTPRVKKDKPEAKVEKVEAPASIIVSDEKPAKKTAAKKDVAKTEEVEAPAKKAAVKKAAPKKETKAEEAARLKKLDEKLDELLK